MINMTAHVVNNDPLLTAKLLPEELLAPTNIHVG